MIEKIVWWVDTIWGRYLLIRKMKKMKQKKLAW